MLPFRAERWEGVRRDESWYNLLVLSYICKIIDIQSFSSQLYEIVIDRLVILAKTTPKQYLGAILISKWF